VKRRRSAPKKKSLRVEQPAPPDLATITKEDLDGRRNTIERLGNLTERVEEGEEGAMPALRGFLDENPDLVRRLGDVARAAENVLLGELTNNGEHPITEVVMRRQLAAMREEIAGEDPSPLEKLLTERVVATWIEVQIFDSFCAQNLRKAHTRQGDYLQRHLDRAHRRHLSAIRTLAQVRKLMRPAVAQINIGEQQVNMAGSPRAGP
jgi:hypothetical protein